MLLLLETPDSHINQDSAGRRAAELAVFTEAVG